MRKLWQKFLMICLGSYLLLLMQHKSFFTHAATSQAKEETQLRAVIQNFFDQRAAKDFDGWLRQWSAQSPDYATLKKDWQSRFTAEDVRFGPLAFSHLKAEGERASLRAKVKLTALDVQSRQLREQQIVRNFVLVRENGEWKVWRYAPAEDDLAEALTQARTEAEQAALLAAEPDLMNASLLAALKKQNDIMLAKRDAQALRMCQLAVQIAEKTGDRKALGQALFLLGVANSLQNRMAQALEHWQKSLAVAEETDDKWTMAQALHALGYRHYSEYRTEQAIELYYRGLTLSQEVGNKPLTVQIFTKLGSAFRSQGLYEAAAEYHQKSRALSEELGNQALLVMSLNNLGDVYTSLGRYAQALECLQRSVIINERLGSAAGKESRAIQLNNIGLVYRRQGNAEQALEYYRQSLKLWEEINHSVRIGELQNNIGVIYKSQELYEQALEWFQKGLKRFEEANLKGNVAMSLNNLGDVYRQQGRYDLASERLGQSLRLREESGNQLGIIRTLNNLSLLYQSQGNFAEMLEASRRAARLAEEINLPEELWTAQDGVGRALRALGQPAQARQNYLAAIATIETLRQQVAGGDLQRQSFLEGKLSPWHGMIDVLVAQPEAAEALRFAEQSKARVLFDLLQTGRPRLHKSLSPPERQDEEERRQRLVSLNTQLSGELRNNQPAAARLGGLKTDLAQARLAYEALETNLYVAHPELKVQRGEAPIIKAEELATLLPDANSALLEYVVTEERAFLFVVTKTANRVDLQAFTLPVKETALTQSIETLRQQLAARDLGFRATATKLYDLLLKPAQAQLKGKTNLVIVPDDKLWELPFQALPTSSNRYLIEDAAISYAPSLTVLREMMKRQKPSASAPTLLALGNPALGKETVERATFATRVGKFDPLPEAEAEVKALGQLYGATRSKVFTGSAAREDRAKAEAAPMRVLHFATHGVLNNVAPMYSHLVLAQSEKEDGLLEAWELMQMDLHADLAVLSACETARGKFGAGEGVIGLTWALFVAGVPSTVVSQWKVESASTRELMLNFHRALKSTRPISKAEALRRAALPLLKRAETSHPFYWAGFVLVGNGR